MTMLHKCEICYIGTDDYMISVRQLLTIYLGAYLKCQISTCKHLKTIFFTKLALALVRILLSVRLVTSNTKILVKKDQTREHSGVVLINYRVPKATFLFHRQLHIIIILHYPISKYLQNFSLIGNRKVDQFDLARFDYHKQTSEHTNISTIVKLNKSL